MKPFIFLLSLFIQAFNFQLFAQNPVTWEALLSKKEVTAGSTVRLQVIGTIEERWKVYALDSPRPSLGLSLKLNPLSPLTQQGDWTQRGVKEMFDPNFEINVRYWAQKAEVNTVLQIPPDAPAQAYPISGELRFQTCDDRVCLPPKKVPFSVVLNVLPKPQNSAASAAKPPTPPIEALDPLGKPNAQEVPVPSLVWQPRLDNPAAAVNGLIQMSLSTSLPKNWRLVAPQATSTPLQITVQDPFLLEGVPKFEPLKKGFIKGLKAEAHYMEATPQIKALFRVGKGANEQTKTIAGSLHYLLCNEAQCTPQSASFSMPVSISTTNPSAPEALVKSTPARSNATTQQAKLTEGGMGRFLLLALLSALAALLTPCVFPMIPLTVSFFTYRTEDRKEAVTQALVYGLAIIGTFTGLGLLMAAISGAAGAQTIAANPWVNLLIGVIFLVFAFSLLGFYVLTLPSSVINYFNAQGNERQGYLGILFMGFTLTLVSFSCTVPFVGALLAATTQGEWFYPILGMLAFSTIFALPFVLFALFPNALSRLPKSGVWMNTFKITLGFVELAAAIKFLSNADLVWGTNWLSRSLAIAICMVIFSLAALYLLGFIRLPHDTPPQKLGVGRIGGAVFFMGITVYLASGVSGQPLAWADAYLPPVQALHTSQAANATLAKPDELTWFVNQGGKTAAEAKATAFAEAKSQNKPVFIDFTGYTCTNCRQMEATVFEETPIENRFKKDFVLLRLYTDDEQEGPALQDYQLGLTGTVALPTYAIIDANGKLLGQWSGLASTAEFEQFLAATPKG